VDAIQSVGALPVDVRAMGIDFLSADGHKWMLGPEGAGLFYCRREILERVRPVIVGWMNVTNAQSFGQYDYTLRPDAGRFEAGSHNVAGLVGLKASLELLASVGIEAIAGRIKLLTDRLAAGLVSRGYHLVSPRSNNQWSGSVCFTSMKHRHEDLVRELRRQHKVEIALREGRLRVSPHFYNREDQIDRLLEYLPRH
jgi:selenocysteine lyase/cysteine desulfurase